MLHRILIFIIVLLFWIDGFILFGISWYGPLGFLGLYKAYTIFPASFILLQLPVLYLIVHKAYIWPIHDINKEIARFMTGIQDEVHIENKSWSKWMTHLMTFLVKSLQILKVFKQELRDGRKLRSEVEIASEIQKHVMDKEAYAIPWLEIAMATEPASEVWWDSVDIIVGKDGNYYIYVGDVTGHWVPSWFVMMMVNALISAFSRSESNGANILAHTNTILKPRVKQNMMMTCVMVRWDSQQKHMYFTGAWHEYILVFKAKQNKVYKVKTWWVALWMVKDSSKILKEQQIAFEEDDVIVLYTDGITEARYRSDQNGMLFGIDRIVNAIMKSKEKNATRIFEQITIDLSAFMGYKHKQYDDITLAVIRCLWPNAPGHTLGDIAESIDISQITEWNWWNIHSITKKLP
jgi:serine phosphatase RsbU (regulator of sigma subunit)